MQIIISSEPNSHGFPSLTLANYSQGEQQKLKVTLGTITSFVLLSELSAAVVAFKEAQQ
jgi:hypothetical protein